MSMTKPPEIGKVIKAYRIDKKISLAELSERSGVSKGMLSQIENGSANPTIATAWKISTALGYSLHQLFGEEQQGDAVEVIRHDEAFAFEADNGDWKISVLSPPRMAEVLELYWIEMKPGAKIDSKPHVNGAIEFATVISGDLEIASGDSKRKVSKGDTARYGADSGHCLTNTGEEVAQIYLVVKF